MELSVKPVTPSEIGEFIESREKETERRKKRMEHLVLTFNDLLRTSPTGTKAFTFTVPVEEAGIGEMCDVVKRFTNVGWKMTFEQDRKEGFWVVEVWTTERPDPSEEILSSILFQEIKSGNQAALNHMLRSYLERHPD